MCFSTVVSALAVGAGVASAAFHSGRSLKDVGKVDKHPTLGRRALETQRSRRPTSQYLTNSTASQLSYSIPGHPGPAKL